MNTLVVAGGDGSAGAGAVLVAAAGAVAVARLEMALTQCSRHATKRQLAPYEQASGRPPAAVALGQVRRPPPGSVSALAAVR